MGSQVRLEERYADIEELLKESLSDKSITAEKEDMVLEYLCQTISKTDSQENLEKRAQNGDANAYIQLASRHIAQAKNIKDYCEAHKYASKAAKLGYVEAYYILGQLYLYGVGCTKNIRKAIRCLSYFVNQISPKELLNDDVLVDAYCKLAEAEKSLGHYENSYFYYSKLQKFDSHYEAYANEMFHEMKNHRSTYTFGAVLAASSFVVLCGVIFVMVHYLNRETQEFAERFPEKEMVAIAEPTEKILAKMVPSEKIEIREPVSYRFVSGDEFMAMSLTEIDIMKAESTSEYISTKGNDFSAQNLIDHDSETTWQEGEEDCGLNQELTFQFAQEAIVSAMRIENGKISSTQAFFDNNRLASFRIFGDENLLVELPDTMDVQYIVFEYPIMQKQVTMIIESVFGGEKWNDTCVSEITFYE